MEAFHLDSQSISLDMLPNSAQELCEIIGINATLKLCEALGGIRITAGEDAVRAAIGQEAQEQLLYHYADQRFDPPRCLAALRAAEESEIARKRSQGILVRDIAIAHRCTERRVYEVLARIEAAKAAANQGDLFAPAG